MSVLSGVLKRFHGPVYAERIRVLTDLIVPNLEQGDRVLDVGSGSGALGRAVLDAPGRPPGVEVRGLERSRRGDEAIPTDAYDGETPPYPAGAFDVVILADVLHHEADPLRLLSACARLSRRLVIIKDHQVAGPLAWPRIALIDWAANAPYGVPCRFRYNTPADWVDWRDRQGLKVVKEWNALRLYPQPYNALFGNRLQYMAVLRVPEPSATALES